MKTLVSGSSGLVGTALCERLRQNEHTVTRLVRSPLPPDESHIAWNSLASEIDQQSLEGFDAVVHLAGENIASGRWSEERKNVIRNSRIDGTTTLASAISKLSNPPRVFISASAIGFYGNRGEEELTEDSRGGRGFLAELCQNWETASKLAESSNTRVINLRTGVVLAKHGGALAKMLLPFRLGLGGKVGSGAQYMSWISLEDTVGAILHCLRDEALSGPVNVVAPEPITNLEFTRRLGWALRRPTFFPLPAAIARIALGEMADELLLSSTRVMPRVLEQSNFSFKHPTLESALKDIL